MAGAIFDASRWVYYFRSYDSDTRMTEFFNECRERVFVNANVRIENAKVGAVTLPEGGIVILAKSFRGGIRDELHRERKLACAGCQSLGYVEGDDHPYCGSAVRSKISKQRRHQGAVSMTDD